MYYSAIRYNARLNMEGLVSLFIFIKEFLVARVYLFVQGIGYHPNQYTVDNIYRVVLRNLEQIEAFEARDYYAVPYSS
jgi:hypothetical protein